MFAPIPGEAAITLDREQAFLGPLTEFTVYSRELIGLGLASEVENPIAIFTDNQALIAAVKTPRQQSGQFVLKRLASKIQALSKDIHIL